MLPLSKDETTSEETVKLPALENTPLDSNGLHLHAGFWQQSSSALEVRHQRKIHTQKRRRVVEVSLADEAAALEAVEALLMVIKITLELSRTMRRHNEKLLNTMIHVDV